MLEIGLGLGGLFQSGIAVFVSLFEFHLLSQVSRRALSPDTGVLQYLSQG